MPFAALAGLALVEGYTGHVVCSVRIHHAILDCFSSLHDCPKPFVHPLAVSKPREILAHNKISLIPAWPGFELRGLEVPRHGGLLAAADDSAREPTRHTAAILPIKLVNLLPIAHLVKVLACYQFPINLNSPILGPRLFHP